MTVERTENGTILLHGICGMEDAEPLIQILSRSDPAIVDWRGCESAHTAIIQVLLAVKPELIGPAGNAFLADRIEPLVRAR